MNLTLKQKRFADEYIISGNASDAARKAGYSEKTARCVGAENLTKPHIKDYINERVKKLEDAKVMDLTEALQRATAIARREVQQGYTKTTNKLTGEVEKELSYEFSPSVEEAQRSLEHIIRIHGGFLDKSQISADLDVQVTIDYGDD